MCPLMQHRKRIQRQVKWWNLFFPRPQAFCLLLLVFWTSPAGASGSAIQTAFPNKPLTIIVPFGPGGGSHQMATHIAVPLSRIMGVDVNVVTMPGNNSKDGVSHFMQLTPDGHTILQHVDILASLFATGEIDINPVKDLIPEAITQITFSQIYIRNIEPRFHNWFGFLEYARRNPDKLRIANTGSPQSMEQVSMQQLKKRLNFSILSDTYDRPAKRYMSLVEKKVDALFEQPGDVAPFLERKLIKPILTILPERIDAFLDTPALREIGEDAAPLYRFRGFFIHSDVPDKIRRYLDRCFKQAYQSPSFKEFNRKKYMHLIDSYRNSDNAKKVVGDAIETYRILMQNAG
jgi:tripartite-type tricarboxylate transporter receptor subunit TctC